MKKIGVAIVGCGVIAPTHADSYLLDPDVTIVHVCDIIPERAAEFATRYGVKKYSVNPNDVWNDPSVNAVSICTPHDSHAQLCQQALLAGKDVICEKPIANTIQGINLLCRLQREHPDRVFAGIFQHRYNPIFHLVHDLVQEGAFGKLLTASMQHRCLRTAEYYRHDAWRGTKRRERGGVLINQAIHYLDLFQWIMGGVSEVKSFSANLTHQGIIETEDTIVGVVQFKNGALGTIEATNSARQSWDTQLHITGSCGCISIVGGTITSADFSDPSIAARLESSTKELNENIAGKIGKSHYGYGHPVQIADFLSAIRFRRTPFVTANDAASAARLTLALYRKACR